MVFPFYYGSRNTLRGKCAADNGTCFRFDILFNSDAARNESRNETDGENKRIVIIVLCKIEKYSDGKTVWYCPFDGIDGHCFNLHK